MDFVCVTRPCAARTRMRVNISVEPLLCSCHRTLSPPQRKEEERGNSKNVSALFSWSLHLARDGFTESTCCCVRARFLGMETKLLFSLLWYIQCYFLCILSFELILKEICCINSAACSNSIWLLSIPQRF